MHADESRMAKRDWWSSMLQKFNLGVEGQMLSNQKRPYK